MCDVWEVVGGATAGGIIVRDGWSTSSAQAQLRLSHGAIVRTRQFDAGTGRLHFELLEGAGPECGWVSTKFQGKALLAKIEHRCAFVKQNQESDRIPSGQGNDDQQDSRASQENLRKYIEQLRRICIDFDICPCKKSAERCNQPVDQVSRNMPKTLIQTELDHDIDLLQKYNHAELITPARRSGAAFEIVKDSDGEELHLCRHCMLPLGDFAHVRDGKYMHGECIAQTMDEDLRAEDVVRLKKEKLAKEKMRAEYDIGWTKDRIPSTSRPATKWFGHDVCDGMVCVMMDSDTNSIRLAATTEPAVSVNLEYLSIALKVRQLEGHEPVFSLNPVNRKNMNAMQEKVFVPEWLAGHIGAFFSLPDFP
jgi:hypothetical protein